MTSSQPVLKAAFSRAISHSGETRGSQRADHGEHAAGVAACPHCAGTGRLQLPSNQSPVDGVAALVWQCVVLGIEVIDGHVSERDAARLVGRSPHTLKRRRLTDRPIDCLKYLGRTRYRLSELAAFKAAGTILDE